MDDIQRKIVDYLSQHKESLANRSKLKGILADFLPDDKKHLNLILDAYDVDFHLRIQEANEKTLVALQFIKILEDNYGISAENARWSIEVWCALLGYEDVLNAFSIMEDSLSNGSKEAKKRKVILDETKEYDLGLGVYQAGVDFPFGEITLTAKWNKGEKNIIEFGIGSTPNIKKTSGEFVDKTYLKISEGQFIKFTLRNMGYVNDLKVFKAKKISD